MQRCSGIPVEPNFFASILQFQTSASPYQCNRLPANVVVYIFANISLLGLPPNREQLGSKMKQAVEGSTPFSLLASFYCPAIAEGSPSMA